MFTRSRTKPIYVLILCALSYAIIYCGRQNLSIAAPLLQEGGILNEATIGYMGSLFFAFYAIGRLINGWLGDRVPPMRLLFCGFFLTGLCNLILGFLPAVWLMLVLWGCNGYAQSMVWGPSLRLVTQSYAASPHQSRAVLTMSMAVGMANLMGVILPFAFSAGGVEAIFLGAGAVLLVFALLQLTLPTYPSSPAPRRGSGWKRLDSDVWWMLFPAACHGIIKDMVAYWTPLLLIAWYGLDLRSAAFYIFLMPAATFAGRLLLPSLYRLLRQNEKRVAAVAFLAIAAGTLPFAFGRPPVWVSVALLAVAAVSTSVINGAFLALYPVRYREQNCVSTVSGILDAASYMASALGSSVYGTLIFRAGARGYRYMLLSWMVLALLSPLVLALGGRTRRTSAT